MQVDSRPCPRCSSPRSGPLRSSSAPTERLAAVEDVADDLHEDVGPAAETEDGDAAPVENRPRPAKKSGRRSVPSWDDVMFGAKSRD